MIITILLLQTYNFTADDLKDLGEIGRGNYGTVNKMLHEQSDTIMSVKVSFELFFSDYLVSILKVQVTMSLYN